MPFEQKGQTMTLTIDDPRHPCNTVTISCAQHEALMALVTASAALEADIRKSSRPSDWFRSMADMMEKLAALRAAGIHEEEEK